MKKKLLFLPIVLAAMLLTGCEGLNITSLIPQPSDNSEQPQSSEEELSNSVEELSSITDPEFNLSESGNDPVSSSEADPVTSSSATDPGEFIDYVHNGTVKLDVDLGRVGERVVGTYFLNELAITWRTRVGNYDVIKGLTLLAMSLQSNFCRHKSVVLS